MKILLDPIFKPKDRVYHYRYGWGTIMDIHNGINKRILIEFDEVKNLIREMKSEANLLSFNEYKLEGFSQERPEVLPEIGDVVWIRSEFPTEWVIGHFLMKENGNYYVNHSPTIKGWHSFGTEIRTTNPFKR